MSVLQRLGERFWVVPALLCLAALLVAEGLVALDTALGRPEVPGWVDLLLYRVGESGSRDILGAIATSSLAVAGTTFSITMAVLALASSTYGPRLVRNFMADRANQTVLGVFVATFLYSLVVLRSIRVIGDPGDQQAEVFVPHLAVNGAVLLAIADVAVLIYFIHHISEGIQVSTLASGVRAELHQTIERLYPEQDEPEDPSTRGQIEDVRRRTGGATVNAEKPGYVQFVRESALVDLAQKHDVVIDLRIRPGVYLLSDSTMAAVHQQGDADDDTRAAVRDGVRSAIEISDARTPHQDPEFAAQQLTEMAVRALSPSTNDPYTAINALNELSSTLALLASRPLPSPARYDADGALRVLVDRPDANDMVVPTLDHVRWYATQAPSVVHAALDLVERVGSRARHPSVRATVLSQLDLLVDAFVAAGHPAHDCTDLVAHADRVRHSLQLADDRSA